MKSINICETEPLLAVAKWAFTTRRVVREDAVSIRRRVEGARAGDLVLAKVTEIGSHRRIQLTTGRTSDLYPDDLVVAACAARYASDQFEGAAEIHPRRTVLLAGGGCLGSMRIKHDRKKGPTRLVPIGLLEGCDGDVLNLERYAISTDTGRRVRRCLAVVGASMNAGKTTAAAAVIRGLVRAGHRVSAIKATGTGAFGDYNAYSDAGAHLVADFTDTGMASTYLQPVSRIERSLNLMLAASGDAGCDVAVVEFADGILQRETAALLGRESVRELFGTYLYAIGDPLSALGGQIHLSRLGIFPAALTGLLAASPLAAEEAREATGLPVLTPAQLADPVCAAALVHGADGCRVVRELAA